MLCNAVLCIKNLSKEEKAEAIKNGSSTPWNIERTCHYLKEGTCPKLKRFWEKP